jgi:hypothetical protein
MEDAPNSASSSPSNSDSIVKLALLPLISDITTDEEDGILVISGVEIEGPVYNAKHVATSECKHSTVTMGVPNPSSVDVEISLLDDPCPILECSAATAPQV